MIIELVTMSVKPELARAFEAAYRDASPLMSRAKGNLGHELKRSVETPGRYILLIRWAAIEDHLNGFRGSPDHAEWQRRLHPFYAAKSVVEHYGAV
jgi:heme-degrading monooxygenase HmoA